MTVNTLTVTGFFLFLVAAPAMAAEPAFDRVVNAAKASAIIPDDIIETAKVACETALCFARTLSRKNPDHVRLEAVDHPDTDSIRWAKTGLSLLVEGTTDTLRLKLVRFGRKALSELREAMADTGDGLRVVLDLRGNPGGDFERMLTIAGLLIGPARNAVEIDHGGPIERRSLDGPAIRNWQVESVEVDGKTASAALLLARLLVRHGGAKLIGPPIEKEPVFLKQRIPIDHDWRLVLPVAEVRIVRF